MSEHSSLLNIIHLWISRTKIGKTPHQRGQSVNRFERSNGPETAQYKTTPLPLLALRDEIQSVWRASQTLALQLFKYAIQHIWYRSVVYLAIYPSYLHVSAICWQLFQFTNRYTYMSPLAQRRVVEWQTRFTNHCDIHRNRELPATTVFQTNSLWALQYN